MNLWVLVYNEHYSKYLESKHLEKSTETFQSFLREIGTIAIQFHAPPTLSETGHFSFQQVPPSSCIRLRTSDEYRFLVRESLFPREPQDKSRRSSSCTIV